jgi:flagellar basal body-associated protein FliL
MRYKNPNKKVLIIIPAVLLLAGGYAYYRSHKKGAPESNTVTASQETKGEAKASPNDSQSSGSPNLLQILVPETC